MPSRVFCALLPQDDSGGPTHLAYEHEQCLPGDGRGDCWQDHHSLVQLHSAHPLLQPGESRQVSADELHEDMRRKVDRLPDEHHRLHTRALQHAPAGPAVAAHHPCAERRARRLLDQLQLAAGGHRPAAHHERLGPRDAAGVHRAAPGVRGLRAARPARGAAGAVPAGPAPRGRRGQVPRGAPARAHGRLAGAPRATGRGRRRPHGRGQELAAAGRPPARALLRQDRGWRQGPGGAGPGGRAPAPRGRRASAARDLRRRPAGEPGPRRPARRR
mmetsp:Transcript_80138/g.226854  ORF Transcript_80138/g.226854 Transcript_80138/m.226854 type:complete len:273 (+) Transcript_80138:245-1063(+)